MYMQHPANRTSLVTLEDVVCVRARAFVCVHPPTHPPTDPPTLPPMHLLISRVGFGPSAHSVFVVCSRCVHLMSHAKACFENLTCINMKTTHSMEANLIQNSK